MPASKKSPILSRYWLARLRVLQRPSVWKAAAVPLLAMTIASFYWMRLSWLGIAVGDRPSPQSTASPSPTPSFDPAALDPADLDIDTLPNLGTLGLPASRSGSLSPVPLPSGGEAAGSSVPLPLAPPASPALAAGTVPSRNPFSPNYAPNQRPGAIANPLGGTTSMTGDRPSAAASTNPAGGLGASGSESSLHPLDAALQRQATPAMPQGNTGAPLLTGAGQSADEAGGDRLSPTGTLRLSPTLPGQPASGFYAPRTSPPLGSTGYPVPSNIQTAPVQSFPANGGSLPAGLQLVPLQSGSSTSSGRQNGSDATRPQFGNGSFYSSPVDGSTGAIADPEPPPFSSSDQRGRNGQINTFSNP